MYFQNAILVPMWLKIIATIYYPIFCRHCNTPCHLILITTWWAFFSHFTSEEIETGTLGNLLKIMQLINAKSYQALSPAPSALPNTASHLGNSKRAIFHRRVTHLSGGWVPEQPSLHPPYCATLSTVLFQTPWEQMWMWSPCPLWGPQPRAGAGMPCFLYLHLPYKGILEHCNKQE